MAIHELETKSIPSSQVDALRSKLCEVLQSSRPSPAAANEPYVIRERGGIPEYAHYYVIWREFDGVDNEMRSKIITEAVYEVLGTDQGLRATVAMGLTPAEAVNLGFLPYKVEADWRNGDRHSFEEYQAAVRQESQNTLSGAGSRELRYATRAEAEDALSRVEAALPGSKWSLVKEEK